MCGRTGMSWRRRSTPGSRTGSRGGDDRVCLRRGEGLRSFQGGRETWKTASWQPAGSRIRLPLKESDIPVAVNPKSADGPSNNPQCGFWDSQFPAAQVKSVEQPCVGMVRAINEIGFKPKMIGGAMVGLQATVFKTQLGPLLNGIVNFDFWLPVPKMNFPGVAELMSKYQARAASEGVDPLG